MVSTIIQILDIIQSHRNSQNVTFCFFKYLFYHILNFIRHVYSIDVTTAILYLKTIST